MKLLGESPLSIICENICIFMKVSMMFLNPDPWPLLGLLAMALANLNVLSNMGSSSSGVSTLMHLAADLFILTM